MANVRIVVNFGRSANKKGVQCSFWNSTNVSWYRGFLTGMLTLWKLIECILITCSLFICLFYFNKTYKETKNKDYDIREERLGIKSVRRKQQEKICTKQSPERSGSDFQFLPHPEKHRTCILSNVKPERQVQNVSTQGNLVWATRPKTFMKSWLHRHILLCNQPWQLKV